MAFYRPYDAKRRLREAIKLGRWSLDHYMTRESRAAASELYRHMRIVWPWKKEKKPAQPHPG